ncbi:hypothetical protein T265_02525 [Opisthorchis viverrini]|uniref:Uncharacterized protein n=1 Tax=Opisthorchis viverrini TaxID=6198 RepID=A0A074ZVS9_OPIVI|nr:hypothetical protein T265_02525 [Opisthorchis viverrini]KER31206.1 hypothetical protein T265_02525 [Opisthorchis viverrini]
MSPHTTRIIWILSRYLHPDKTGKERKDPTSFHPAPICGDGDHERAQGSDPRRAMSSAYSMSVSGGPGSTLTPEALEAGDVDLRWEKLIRGSEGNSSHLLAVRHELFCQHIASFQLVQSSPVLLQIYFPAPDKNTCVDSYHVLSYCCFTMHLTKPREIPSSGPITGIPSDSSVAS